MPAALSSSANFLRALKQARLLGVLRNADDFSNLFHGFLVDKIDDLPVFRRKCGQALAQRLTGVLLCGHFRIVGRIVQFNVLPATQRGQGLESRNRQQPGRNGGSAFELAGLALYIEKHLADQVFRDQFVPYQPNHEAKHPNMVPSVQHLHGKPVALGDSSDQDIVRGRLCRTQWPSRKVGRIGLRGGSMGKAKLFGLLQ
jgi:hypothetical protein